MPASTFVTEQVLVERLRPDPANARRISEDELAALERSIREFDFVQPVVARRDDGVLISGHQRVVAARRMGLASVPVVWFDGTTEQARLLGLALNKISGTWDEQLLARLFVELKATPEVDLSLSGFADDEIGDLVRGLETRERRHRPEAFDLDSALDEAGREPLTRAGDLWRCGGHLVLCGDATNAEDLERLLGGQRATMAFVDPPYNVDLGHHGGQQRDAKRRKPIANDALDAAAWEVFVRGWSHNLLRAVDGAVYCAMSSKELGLVSRMLAEEGGHWSDTIIWAKDRFTLGRADYQRAYEPIWYGWREGSRHHWCGDRDQSDVWAIDRPSASPLHPVQKPLALVERAIGNSSKPDDLVLDLFLGSGTTLIAADRTGRRCAGIELDPIYVDVAVRRWEKFSGDVAVRLEPPAAVR
jgi:DNA modification methylase